MKRRNKKRRLGVESLESRHLLAGDTVFETNFEDGSIGQFTTDSTMYSSYEIVKATNRFIRTTHHANESATYLRSTPDGSFDGIDLSYSFRLPERVKTEFAEEDSVGIKLSRFNSPERVSNGNMQNELLIDCFTCSEPHYYIQFYVEPLSEVEGVFNRTLAGFGPGQWLDVRVRAIWNTPGQEDGTFSAWINGSKVFEVQNVPWAETVEARIYDVWLIGNVSRFNDAMVPFQRDFDNLRVEFIRENIVPADVSEAYISFRSLEEDSERPFFFKIRLREPHSETLTVDYRTIEGTADESDVVFQSGTVVFPPGVVRQDIVFDVITDTEVEPDETFFVELVGGTAAIDESARVGIGTILNDDFPISASISPFRWGEETELLLTFDVTLSQASTRTETIYFGTSNGTAVAWQDYIPQWGALTFSPGETRKQIHVPIIADYRPEYLEYFRVHLYFGTVGIDPGLAFAWGVIEDED